MNKNLSIWAASLGIAVVLGVIIGLARGIEHRSTGDTQKLAAEAVAPVVEKALLPAAPKKMLMGPFAPPPPSLSTQAPAPAPPETQAKQAATDPLPVIPHMERAAEPAPQASPDPAFPAPRSAMPAKEAPPSHEQFFRPEAWARHAGEAPVNPGRAPVIAIVIDDMGVVPGRVDAALALPPPMTMAVLPYAADAATVARKARAGGHEVLVHLPMEAGNGDDPGPRALMGRHSREEFNQRLQWNLSRFEGYIGINNHMGSRLTQNPEAMAMLMAQVRRRGLLFLDSRTTTRTLAAATGRSMGVTSLERDIFLDNVITRETILAQLRKSEDIARRRGFAIAIGHPHETTVAVLAEWSKDLEVRGFKLAPLSAITRLQSSPPVRNVVSLPPAGG